ncbi:MAG: DUF5063 domain-containing protein [Alloprevotella sp.]|nr:DUF5063 domain-containing protein [Alloprevotella sp.]MBR1652754.1 DUF5063 domain-containing protein [Alloprevotella sp.]
MDLYAQPVLDFVRISTEFCRQVEQTGDVTREDFTGVMLRLLPMLYLKATLLGDVPEADGYVEARVTEQDYDYVRNRIAELMGEEDTFLEVFVEDFKYSESPVAQTVSENLADVYQVLRNMVEEFRLGYDDAMRAALQETVEQFRSFWGQELLSVLRTLHADTYRP